MAELACWRSRHSFDERIGDFGTLGQEAADGGLGRGGAAIISAAVASIAVVEAACQFGAPQRGRALRIDEVFHAIAPELAVIVAAPLPQVVHWAQDIREAQQLVVVGTVFR